MRVLFVVNRASGTGRAGGLAEACASACEGAGVETALCDARDERPGGMARADSFRRFACVAVVGGDGSLHYLLDTIKAVGVPVYHIPAGTESLFAREFGMTREPGVFVRALEAGRTRAIDLGRVQERDFALMVSFGADAGVVHRLDETRSGRGESPKTRRGRDRPGGTKYPKTTGHAMYLWPVLGEVLRPRVAHVSVAVDGREVVAGKKGMLIVANSRQYARRLDPAREADMSDGLLDVVFFPAQTTAKLLLWAARCAMGEQLGSAGAVWEQGKEIEVHAEGTTPWQCDGEAGGLLHAGENLKIGVEPGAFEVLLPPVCECSV